ncbi:phosphoesterase RecJ domain-containing protein [Caloramator fervidus]|uniref:Phosphoesterase RecJ domain-containing protein n=1 Tax=Caloramator fervidus TaxID=29344 RepID=A0A1H5S621_9CLOT|nr:bifunctional oligoribonuclease/PAP phosphatase NrnA [Caloramator fervidus]SEF45824.1 phosphoesterase RecJ domain-containing protein [Caloramator fervidus]
MILTKIGSIIKQNDNFAIISHFSPDGDAIGSSLALYNMLIENGKSVDIYNQDEVPKRLKFLPYSNYIKNQLLDKKYECVFVLDCGDKDRIGNLVDIFNKTNLIVNIDHHISNTLFADINYVDSNASSVGEIIYNLLKINGFEISKNTAMCLYTSIVSDTGGLKYSNTTSMTLNIAGDLINTGINFTEINRILFNTMTKSQLKLLSKVISTLELYKNDSIAIMHVNKQMLEECGANEDDASDMVNYARDIDTVELGIFIKEVDTNKFKVSLRSKNKVDVRLIAEKFNGGGHVRAAGFTIEGDFETVKKNILEVVSKYWK